jgi:hypothetical protein
MPMVSNIHDQSGLVSGVTYGVGLDVCSLWGTHTCELFFAITLHS